MAYYSDVVCAVFRHSDVCKHGFYYVMICGGLFSIDGNGHAVVDDFGNLVKVS